MGEREGFSRPDSVLLFLVAQKFPFKDDNSRRKKILAEIINKTIKGIAGRDNLIERQIPRYLQQHGYYLAIFAWSR